MFGRREAWPAVAILGVGMLTLAVTLKAAQENMPLNPPWIMAILVALYLALAVMSGGLTWRAPVVLGSMLVAHVVLALMMGWGYGAVDGQSRDAYQAIVQGLWNYLPGTALQFGFACMLGIVVDAHLDPEFEWVEEPGEGEETEEAVVPDLALVADAETATSVLTALPGVAATLLAGPTVHAGGVWARDPQAALARVQALTHRTGSGLNSLPLDRANLLTRSEEGHTAALLVSASLGPQAAHGLLRELWAVGERVWAEPEDTHAAPGEPAP